MRQAIRAFLLGFVFFATARADTVSDVSVPDNTLSPDKRYGITVPHPFSNAGDIFKDNELVEVKSKHVLGSINAETVYTNMNHNELLPAWWSDDDAYLLWQVDGKWGMYTQILVHVKDDEIQWEIDVLTPLQRAILTRTEAADPKKFLAAKKANWGDGSAYPEKFTVDAEADNANDGPLRFPVKFHVYLTSNPKGFDDVPEVDSFMEATLSKDGEITITGFYMGKNRSSPWN
jgi:hypothetical protein